jgi:Asp-tRNA(Asn)/Glu-tRNA(Gln) amidotransferase A subunit family amidase
VQEGSALVAIGTDTGGSIRVPAALCGLAGYRASLTLPEQHWPEAWQGGAHLAPSFDTVGFLLRDPRDLAPVANALFGVPLGEPPADPQIGCVPEAFLDDCEPAVLAAFRAWKQELQDGGARVDEIDADSWPAAPEIFAGIQAHEAAQLHAGRYDQFEPAIRDRLRWGASLSDAEVADLRSRRQAFVRGLSELFPRRDFLMLPCAPVSQLRAGADHSTARPRILRYTTPFSLAGLPAVSLPGEILGAPRGTGIQMAAASGEDAALLAYVAVVGDRIAARR